MISTPPFSLIDLNRSGVALMEIVSKPDMRSPEEAGAYLRKLRAILRYLTRATATWKKAPCAVMSMYSFEKAGNLTEHAAKSKM